jgi:ribosomal protein L12E/L44/L45/RPP1/RPP2
MVMNEARLSVSEFKAKCLELFDRLDGKQLDRIVVTRRGSPVAVVTSPASAEAEARAVHGSMAGMAMIAPGVDLTAPIFDEELDAAHGRVLP